MRFLTVIFLLLFTANSISQNNYPYDKWKPKELVAANNFNSVSFMDSTEKAVLYYVNLVRINPKLFCTTFLQEYLDLNNLDISNLYVASLIATLNNSKSRNVLLADSHLFEMARFHAICMGKSGMVGHKDFEKRIKKYLKGKYDSTGENCSYGCRTAIDIFMSLLIDDGISSLGHRSNILTIDFTSVGISIQPHKKYGINCVMDFGFDSLK